MYLPEQAYSRLSDSLIGNMFWLAGKPNLPIVFSCKKLPRRATKRLITTSDFKSNPLARRGQPPVLVVCRQGQHGRRDDQEPYPLRYVAGGVLGRQPAHQLGTREILEASHRGALPKDCGAPNALLFSEPVTRERFGSLATSPPRHPCG